MNMRTAPKMRKIKETKGKTDTKKDSGQQA